MKIIQITHPVSEKVLYEAEPCLLALGFFDGVHLGHRHLLQTAREIAKRKKLTFAVMTFFPHPRQIVQGASVKVLTPLAVKAERLQKLGVDKLYVIRFDSGFARLSAEKFVKQYIIGLKCKHVVAGYDFRYGCKAQGDMEQLVRTGRGKFAVTTIPKIAHGQEKISSTAIRQLVSLGKVDQVPHYLGDYHEAIGTVKSFTLFHGKYQFIKIMADQEVLLPKPGVYQIEVSIGKQSCKGVCHQISTFANSGELLVQIAGSLVALSEQRVRLRWIQPFFGNEYKMHRRDPGFTQEEFII
ncbi:MAG: FAD synthetase family protein [Thermoactinomyces sp.]